MLLVHYSDLNKNYLLIKNAYGMYMSIFKDEFEERLLQMLWFIYISYIVSKQPK